MMDERYLVYYIFNMRRRLKNRGGDLGVVGSEKCSTIITITLRIERYSLFYCGCFVCLFFLRFSDGSEVLLTIRRACAHADAKMWCGGSFCLVVHL